MTATTAIKTFPKNKPLSVGSPWVKTLIVAGVVILIGGTINLTYARAKNFFNAYSIAYYHYAPGDIKPVVDTSGWSPASAVPILMYHGVLAKADSENTTIKSFISQMEMLKRQGYKTISLSDLDKWLAGNFTLPAKPIIITFDDARKDSYYTTDDVFKKLGFKATIFVVSGKQKEGDKFFLSWNDLRQMRDSGRWEIEAHGTFSHMIIPTDNHNGQGRFLSSLKYLPGQGLEKPAQFEARVEHDYRQNIQDLQDNLGLKALYFAIPLNDYGQQHPSNYVNAYAFNETMVKKYFRLAFVQANDADHVSRFTYGVYNYQGDDPYALKRIEVKNMPAEDLRAILDKQFPTAPAVFWQAGGEDLPKQTEITYGVSSLDGAGLHLFPSATSHSVLWLNGLDHWKNYTLEARAKKIAGRSLAIAGYAKDGRNYVLTGITDHSVFLREFINGEENELAPSVAIDTVTEFNNFKLVFTPGQVSVYFNDKLIFDKIKINSRQGLFGFKAWDDQGQGESLITDFKVY